MSKPRLKTVAPSQLEWFLTPVPPDIVSGGVFDRSLSMKKIPFLMFVLFAAACSATGQQYTPQKSSKGESKIVVYRSPNGGPAPIDVNGVRKCRLPRNGYFVLTVPSSQPLTLSSSLFGDPSVSRFSFTPQPRQTYYVRVEVNSASVVAGSLGGAFGGLVGGTAATVAATQEGSFIFREGSEVEALQTKEGC